MLAGIISGATGTYKCLFHAKEESDTLAFYMQLGPKAPPQHRIKIAEYIARANYGLVIGNFEIDMRDGEIRFKNSLCVKDGQLTFPMIYLAISLSLRTVNKFLPGFMMILFGGADAATAFAKTEEGTATMPEAAKDAAHDIGVKRPGSDQTSDSAVADATAAVAKVTVSSGVTTAAEIGDNIPFCQPVQPSN